MPEDLGDIISGVLCSLLKSSTQQPVLASGHTERKRLSTGDLLAGLAGQNSQPSRQQIQHQSEISDTAQRQEPQSEERTLQQTRSLTGERRQMSNNKDLLAGLVFNFFNGQKK